ncbi:MAG: FAD-binding oxidoreductase [Rhodospirillaceae bacterium]|nr:FAD-binding oxidoreductase [Rhodospirillaceae bacterium]
MNVRRLKFWGWGYADEAVPAEETAAIVRHVSGKLGVGDLPADPDPRIEDVTLPAPRITPPAALAACCSTETYDRAAHTYGKSFPDYVRTLARDFAPAPDVVAFPDSTRQVVEVLDWAASVDAAVIPFGAGSSVVGGVEASRCESYGGVISLDLRRLDKVVEVDKASRAARVQGGVMGPGLEAQLKPHGYSMRHFPQSFEYSTVGGWVATRSGGHFATLYTHIDEFVESLEVVTPAGMIETRRLPGSGAGPSPDRMFIGSEGILGIITEAWLRVQDRPTFRASATVKFTDFHKAAAAVRAIGQAGLYPSNCRVIDAKEAAMSMAGDGSAHLLILAFESADHPVEPWMARALECAKDHGGEADDPKAEAGRDGSAGAWRNAFIRFPYHRDALITRGIIHDTYETAITWDRFADFHATLMAETADVVRRVTGQEGYVSCRFTHVYPDGVAPYFTFHGVGRKDAMLDQWKEIKTAVSDKLEQLGGTITHHHAVGRDHRPWYDRQRPDLFAAALIAAKERLDPQGLLNPGVLVDPRR